MKNERSEELVLENKHRKPGAPPGSEAAPQNRADSSGSLHNCLLPPQNFENKVENS
jgi:hypothetical protein